MITAILLAAGESARMGRAKALLPWAEITLIEYQIGELRAADVDDVVVVLGHAADEVRPWVPSEPSTGSGRVRVVMNEAYRGGRATSLRAGADAVADGADAIVVLNVDQPRPRELIAALLQEHQEGGALITVPAYGGKRGHPTVLSGALLPELRAASDEAQGLRGVLAAHEVETREVDLGSEVVLLDINTPDEYERALEL